MARETLKAFFQNAGKNFDSISYTIDAESGGDGTKFDRGDDLGKDPNSSGHLISETEGITGDYLKYVVDESSNEFKFKPGNTIAASSLRGNDLQKSAFHGTESTYVSQGTIEDNKLSEYSNSGYFDNEDNKLSDVVDKIGATGYNHDILSSIEGQSLGQTNQQTVNPAGEDNPAIQASHEMLRKHNRFNAAAESRIYKRENVGMTEFETKISDENINVKVDGTINLQDKFGNYEDTSKNALHTYGNLKNIGKSLLLKAGGWDTGYNPSESIDPEGNISLEENAVIASGMKVDGSTVRSKNAFGTPEAVGGESFRVGKGESAEQRNRIQASMYNQNFTYTGVSKNIKKIHAIAALLAVKDSLTGFIGIIENLGGSNGVMTPSEEIESVLGKEVKYNGPGPHAYGQYRAGLISIVDIIKKNLLVNTTYTYKDSFNTGLKILFSLSDLENEDDKAVLLEKSLVAGVIEDSPDYWLSIALSVIRRSESTFAKIAKISETGFIDDWRLVIKELRSSSLLGFMNVVATVGDIHLKSTGGYTNHDDHINSVNANDVDALADLPGTRVMKSRRKSGISPLEQSTSVRSMPSMYLLPCNVINAAIDLGSTLADPHPAKGMLGSALVEKTYLDMNMDKSYNRIPNDVANRLEDLLEGEYVPFYMHDLRTNEIIAFHAFLTKLDDTIAPSYSAVDGYGRLDPVQIYTKTTRNISIGFKMIATNKEDFDEMWYKINKFTTLLYPQWSKGTTLSAPSGKFIQPFSQVLGASPIVRLRIGDVIKSNYSRFNLSRTFGIGDQGIQPKGDATTAAGLSNPFNAVKEGANSIGAGTWDGLRKIAMMGFYAMYGSPIQYLSGGNKWSLAGADLISNLLINGFANPLAVALIMNQITDPDTDTFATFNTNNSIGTTISKLTGGKNPMSDFLAPVESGYKFLSFAYLKPNRNTGYFCPEDNRYYKTNGTLRVVIVDKKGPSNQKYKIDAMSESSDVTAAHKGRSRNNYNKERHTYTVLPIDTYSPLGGEKQFHCTHADLSPDYHMLFNFRVAPLITDLNALKGGVKGLMKKVGASAGLGASTVDTLMGDILSSDAAKFMNPENNPITRAFESNMGRGLAGTIGTVSFNWLSDDYAWETDFNSRAPKGVDISFSFSVIHDIPPGLDHSGYNRAPVYNVGSIMENISGDPINRLETAKYNFGAGLSTPRLTSLVNKKKGS